MLKSSTAHIARSALFIAILIAPIGLAADTSGRSRPREGATAAKKRKESPSSRKLAKVREELHRNLDGKGDGFIRGWAFDSKTFTLTVDKSRYQKHMIYAAALTARSIFDMNGVPLPKRLVIRDRSGEVLGDGPFANVPKIVE